MRCMLATMLTTVLLAMLLACGGAGDVSDRQAAPPATTSVESEQMTADAEPKQTPVASAYMVRVAVHDDTENRPLHPRAEVWFRGHGSWWLREATEFGSAAENLATRKPNEKDTIHIYPDGRDGAEMVASLMMTNEMNPKGSPRDAVTIAIGDDEVAVYGAPIKAATGEFEMRFER